MYIFDTDHLSALIRGGAAANVLLQRLSILNIREVSTTIVTYEEQTRGWLSLMAKMKTVDRQVEAYQRLQKHLRNFCTIPIIGFDESAAKMFKNLQKARIRIGTMDLKIAAIVLTSNATLLTANENDFAQVPELVYENWLVTTE